eukprot:Protomagalhaensia_wolfi_Nauph_80__55@NODE_1033_length_1787_cov_15_053776_g779_i0_p1_GENE_NODE_1033_length_1787_cov_15_053776_g779_i0NODE_1033_length_1787_cov_15_053776_g779_i0_p1_ORF_typecomplete_len512_score87_40DcuA_DcuB/PF03605_14/5_6e80DcuA_DcuB/PF03605_14/9_7e43DcuC/PF03606_15/0_00068DcuC/PF03606_15/0_00034MatC_N/PF07158_11/4_3e05MatC_N/PF07158_11/5_8e03MatC_N/PF07158_11/1_3e03MatC_N/PF07158_11/1_8e02DUF1824/PF08854_10/0_3CitMHS/PF03600_16/0_13CitMHS/PF03600_16/1_8e04_NODE_1033_length_1787_
MPTGSLPFEVISIIMTVISVIASMQCAGGLDWMVSVAERVLRRNPKYITIIAPLVTFLLTLLAGTGHTSFSTLPVIAEVAKVAGVRPSRAMTVAVTSAQLGICASPISAAVVAFTGYVDQIGVSYMVALAVTIPSCLIATFLVAIVSNFLGKDLIDDPVYADRWERGVCVGGPVPRKFQGAELEKRLSDVEGEEPIEPVVLATEEIKKEVAKKEYPRGLWNLPAHKVSVSIFLVTVVFVVTYSILISDTVGITNPSTVSLGRAPAILSSMLTAALLICLSCKLDPAQVTQTSTFRGGMTAVVCVIGIAWMGDTFISFYTPDIKRIAGDVVNSQPWLLSLIIMLSANFLYSQAVTTNALYPIVVSLGVSKVVAVGAFPAVATLFLLPISPFMLAAVELDTTGSTKIGKYVFDHSFILPGFIHIILALVLAHLFALMIIH